MNTCREKDSLLKEFLCLFVVVNFHCQFCVCCFGKFSSSIPFRESFLGERCSAIHWCPLSGRSIRWWRARTKTPKAKTVQKLKPKHPSLDQNGIKPQTKTPKAQTNIEDAFVIWFLVTSCWVTDSFTQSLSEMFFHDQLPRKDPNSTKGQSQTKALTKTSTGQKVSIHSVQRHFVATFGSRL